MNDKMNDEFYFKNGKREIRNINNVRIKTPWEGDYLYIGTKNDEHQFYN